MSVQINGQSLLESAELIIARGYFKKLNLLTTTGKSSCKNKATLMQFMAANVMCDEEIEVQTSTCNCMKNELNFTQTC